MVLEKDKLEGKQLGSDAVISNDIDEVDDLPASNFGSSQPAAGYSPTGKQAGKIVFHESTKKKI